MKMPRMRHFLFNMFYDTKCIYGKYILMSNIFQIIKEEIQNFYSDWQSNDEPSIADKYYEKKGITTKPIETPINAELIGYVNKQINKLINPVPVYKNPKNLNGFSNDTRGILMSNGDLYLAQNYMTLHDNILDLLAEHGIVSYGSKFGYAENYPKDFVAVVRVGNSNTFGQSTAYDVFPNYYIKIFDIAEEKQPFGFQYYSLQ